MHDISVWNSSLRATKVSTKPSHLFWNGGSRRLVTLDLRINYSTHGNELRNVSPLKHTIIPSPLFDYRVTSTFCLRNRANAGMPIWQYQGTGSWKIWRLETAYQYLMIIRTNNFSCVHGSRSASVNMAMLSGPCRQMSILFGRVYKPGMNF